MTDVHPDAFRGDEAMSDIELLLQSLLQLADITMKDLGASPVCREQAQNCIKLATAMHMKWSEEDGRTNDNDATND